MRNLIKVLCWCVCFTGIFSCKTNMKEKCFNQLIGQKIIFPKELTLNKNNKDTLIPDLFKRRAKLIILYDTVGCTPCRIKHLKDWNYILELSQQLNENFYPLFIIQPNVEDSLQTRIILSDFNFPVLYDPNKVFTKQNSFLLNECNYNVFLIDSMNKIILIGDPNTNNKLRQLYIETIKKLCK